MLQPGDQIDIWVVERALGAGGMGSVYRCHNRHARRILAAVKVLDSSVRRVQGAEERFAREADILGALDHENIVRIRNVRLDVSPPYLEMEFVEGDSLEAVIKRGPMDTARALDVALQLADALAYLHERGICHRDIKPANLLLRADGAVKLVDFGLAVETDTTRITQAGMTFGTVSYAPPEWMTPETLDPVKWDIYALGVVLHEMLMGDVAFAVSGQGSARHQALQLMMAKQNHAPLDPGPVFAPEVRELVGRLTHADPDGRPESARAVVELLTAMDRGVPAPLKLASTEDVDSGLAARTWFDEPEPEPAPSPKDGPSPTIVAPSNTTIDPLDERDEVPYAPAATPAAGRRYAAWAMLGFGAAGLALGAVGLAAAAWFYDPAPPTRDVVISVRSDLEVLLRAGDQDVELDAGRASLAAVEVGELRVAWLAGDGCSWESCPGAECPVWCGTGESTVGVTAGEGALAVDLPVRAPTVDLVLSVPKQEPPLSLSTEAGSIEIVDGVARVAGLAPGELILRVSAGICPEDGATCVGAACPPGCGERAERIELPWREGELQVDLAPLPVVATPLAPPSSGTVPRPSTGKLGKSSPDEPPPSEPSPSSGPAGPLVTTAEFAAWLEANPTWLADAARDLGFADGSYLKGWSGASPGSNARPVMTSVSWYAAAAFCRSRGGVADVNAEPIAWTEGASSPYLEWRTDGGRAAWRRSDGKRNLSAVDKRQATSATGFRCAR